jgi:hypothetical protein
MNTIQLVNQGYELEQSNQDDYVYLDFQNSNQEIKMNRNKRRMISAKIAFEKLEREFLRENDQYGDCCNCDVDIYSENYLEDFCMNDELKAWEESFMRGYLNEAIEEQ